MNVDLNKKVEETTELLNDAKSKLNLQNHLMQKGYEDYQGKLVSKNTTINQLESSLKEANSELKNEIHLTKSLKEKNAEKDTLIEGLERLNLEVKSELEKTKQDIQMLENQNEIHLTNSLKEKNAEKDTMIEGLERSNVKVKSELEKTKLDIQMLENQLKTCRNNLIDLNAGSRAQLKHKIKELENSNVEFKFKEFKWNKTKQDHLSEVAFNDNKIKDLEIQMKTLKEELKVA